MGLIFDTNFAVAAERDARRGTNGRTDAFLAQRTEATFFIIFPVAGEPACGQSAATRRDWQRLCRPYPVLPWTMEIAWHDGEIYRALAVNGQLIGGNDLWIAATALTHGFCVVTNNHAEFSRVPGLTVAAF